MQKIKIIKLSAVDIDDNLLSSSHHRQIITTSWVRTNNGWETKVVPELREWDSRKEIG
jgi:hypothetical protein